MSDARSVLRRRRPAIDPRLLIGIVLVVVSVAGVVALVGAADRRVAVFAASASLVPGDRVGVDDLLIRHVALDGATALYLQPGDVPADGLVTTHVIGAGELVPLAAVGERSGTDTTSIVLPLSGPVSSAISAGAVVDVWSSSAPAVDTSTLDQQTAGPPIVLTPDATVVRVVEPEGIVGAADGEAVELLIPRSRIARVLQAIARGDALAVVPAGIPLGRR